LKAETFYHGKQNVQRNTNTFNSHFSSEPRKVTRELDDTNCWGKQKLVLNKKSISKKKYPSKMKVRAGVWLK
jgi:hypothetical protein